LVEVGVERGVLFPSPVKNLWSSQLKSLPQYFYSSKNDGFMKKKFLYIFYTFKASQPLKAGNFPRQKFFQKGRFSAGLVQGRYSRRHFRRTVMHVISQLD